MQQKLPLLNNDLFIFADGKFQKSFYDARDGTGIHLSDGGAVAMYNSFTDFFFHGESDELTSVFELPTPMSKKRERGSSSGTPPSADRKSKQAKSYKS